MTNFNFLPTTYSEFKKIKDLRKHKEHKKQLTRFVFRYRLANAFVGMHADGVGKTLNGYNVVMKVFLAYTAYEQLHRSAVGLNIFMLLPVDQHKIINRELASKLRANKLLIDFLVQYTTFSTIKNLIADFKAGRSDDIVCIAYALRNVFAHGELTATAVGTTLKTQRNDLFELADVLLDFCNEHFTYCIEKLR